MRFTSLSIQLFMGQEPIEFQIRTKECTGVAEYGVAAHWGIKGQEQQGICYWNELDQGDGLQDQADDMNLWTLLKTIWRRRSYIFTQMNWS